jgi:hypothetical protein
MKLVTHPAQTRALFVGIVDGSGWWVPHPHPGGVYARAGAHAHVYIKRRLKSTS